MAAMRAFPRWRNTLSSLLGIGVIVLLCLASASCKKKPTLDPTTGSDSAANSHPSDVEREAGPMPEWDHTQPLKMGTAGGEKPGESDANRSPSPEIMEISRAIQDFFVLGDCQGTVLMADRLETWETSPAVQETLFPVVLCYLAGPGDLRNRDRAVELLQRIQRIDPNSVSGRKASLLLTLVLQSTELEHSSRDRQERIRDLEREVRGLEEELKGLKEIDLRKRRPPD